MLAPAVMVGLCSCFITTHKNFYYPTKKTNISNPHYPDRIFNSFGICRADATATPIHSLKLYALSQRTNGVYRNICGCICIILSMKEIPDYQAMEQEYSKIKPMTVQSSPYTGETNPNQTIIKPLVRLYRIYKSIDCVIAFLVSVSKDKDLILLAEHLSKKVVGNLSALLSEPLPSVEPIPRPNGYSSAVRYALLRSAEGCCSALEYKQQIPYLSERLDYEDILTLHMIILTLTAF